VTTARNNPAVRYAGWDIGGTKSGAVVGNSAGEILACDSWPSETARGPRAMLEDFLSHLAPLEKEFGPFASLGVSVGGPLDSKRGVILSPPHLPGWDNLPLRDMLMEKLRIPVRVEHDAAACLLAEHYWGNAAGKTHAAYITAGTGCGAGILVDGRILRGPSGQSPEIGHIRLAEDGPKLFGKAGCVESFCSGTGIALLANKLFPVEFPQPVTTRELAELAASGDSSALTVLLTAARWMGRTCALLTDIFSLEVVIIGSLARYLPSWWLDAVRAEFTREVLAENGAHTAIEAPALGDRLQDLSAIAPCVGDQN
jgi:glucokinase